MSINWKEELSINFNATLKKLQAMKAESLKEEVTSLEFQSYCDYEEHGILIMWNVIDKDSPNFRGTFAIRIKGNEVKLGSKGGRK